MTRGTWIRNLVFVTYERRDETKCVSVNKGAGHAFVSIAGMWRTPTPAIEGDADTMVLRLKLLLQDARTSSSRLPQSGFACGADHVRTKIPEPRIRNRYISLAGRRMAPARG